MLKKKSTNDAYIKKCINGEDTEIIVRAKKTFYCAAKREKNDTEINHSSPPPPLFKVKWMFPNR